MKFSVAMFLLCSCVSHALAGQGPPADPVAANLFPPELVMQYQLEIKLTDDQRNALMAEIQKTQSRLVDLQDRLQKQVEALGSLLKKDDVDEQSALAQALTREQFRYGFGNTLPAQESDELYDRWAIPSPGKTLFEAAFANFTPNSPAKVNTRNKTRGPLLVTAGGKDHTVPHIVSTSTRRLYHRSPAITDFREFPDRGHSLTTDHGWRDVAREVLDWLKQRSL